ncbi:hypothetical protein [Parasitella parasitica]|uniref:Uncharacterized protein n=1 Tax=Parasitella parasitica TaxID=35722 RepID=A0A0B7NIZ4_9FUNG|nr:hypothetical protein [Parasitella parasitica]
MIVANYDELKLVFKKLTKSNLKENVVNLDHSVLRIDHPFVAWGHFLRPALVSVDNRVIFVMLSCYYVLFHHLNKRQKVNFLLECMLKEKRNGADKPALDGRAIHAMPMMTLEHNMMISPSELTDFSSVPLTSDLNRVHPISQRVVLGVV